MYVCPRRCARDCVCACICVYVYLYMLCVNIYTYICIYICVCVCICVCCMCIGMCMCAVWLSGLCGDRYVEFQSHVSRQSWIAVQGCHGLYKVRGFRVNPKPSTLNRASILHVSLQATVRNGGIQQGAVG